MVTKSGVLMESRKSLFVVIRRYGPPYDPQKPLEAQLDWEGHRLFMNALEAEGLARLAGPLEGTTEVLLVFRADSENEIFDLHNAATSELYTISLHAALP